MHTLGIFHIFQADGVEDRGGDDVSFQKYCYVNKKLCNLLVNSKGNIFKTTLNPDKRFFYSFSNGSLKDVKDV